MSSMSQCVALLDECMARVMRAPAANADVAEWVRDYADDHRHRLAHDVNLVRHFALPGAKVLEFGSAPFFLTLALQRQGYQVCGLDIAPEILQDVVSGEGLDVLRVDFEREPVPLPDDSFDVVLFNEVFEHLRINPIFTMSEVHRVLKRGGTLLLSSPNHRSLVGLWTLLWHHCGCHVCPDVFEEYDKLRRLGHMGHVREYTAREVSRFLARIGLHTQRVIFRYYRPRCRTSLALKVRDVIERAAGTVMPGTRPLFSLVCAKGEPMSQVSGFANGRGAGGG